MYIIKNKLLANAKVLMYLIKTQLSNNIENIIPVSISNRPKTIKTRLNITIPDSILIGIKFLLFIKVVTNTKSNIKMKTRNNNQFTYLCFIQKL